VTTERAVGGADFFSSAGLEQAIRRWHELGLPAPAVVVVGGSGFGIDLGVPLRAAAPLEELLPFELVAVDGHCLSYELLGSEANPVLYLRGRLHAYQGFAAGEVVFAVRLAGLLGAHTLVVTNAAGAVARALRAGDLVAIRDHLNFTGLNPLVGRPPAPWGPQFPDLARAYDADLRECAREHARELGVELHEGVYLGLLGPSYETPAEVEAYRRLGADVVGMSTVLEVIAARHLGLRCFGLSLVTNLAAGIDPEGALDHADVLDVGKHAAPRVRELLQRLLDDPMFLSDRRRP
jgi:purine-nucleoside phosphorylase